MQLFSLNFFLSGLRIKIFKTTSYCTKIDAQLQIYQDGNSEAIETIELPNITDESTSERQDYFQSFELNLPSHLATGKYQIRLELRDRLTYKEARSSVDFQVR